MSWNSYSSYTRNSTIKPLRKNTNTKRNEETNDKKTIWVRLPYLGKGGDEMKKCCSHVMKQKKKWLCFVQPKTLFPHSKSQMLFIASHVLDVISLHIVLLVYW